MTGNIEGGKVAEVFRDLILEKKSGLLFLKQERSEKGIYFAHGKVVNAESNLREESLGYRLLEEAILSPQGLEQALAQVEPGRSLRDVLVAGGTIAAEVIDPILKTLAEQVVIGAIEWRHGTHFFQEGDFSFRGEFPLDTAAMVLEGVRRMYDFDAIRERLLRDTRPLRPTGAQPGLQLEPAEGYILSRVDGTLTAADVCALSLISEEMTCRVLFGLLSAAAIGYGAPRAQTPEHAPRPAVSAAESNRERAAGQPSPRDRAASAPAASAAPGIATGERPAGERSPMRPAGGGERVTFRPTAAASPGPPRHPGSVAAGGPGRSETLRSEALPRSEATGPRPAPGDRVPDRTAARARAHTPAQQELLKEVDGLYESLDRLNHYAILGLPRDVPTTAVEEAWQRLSPRFHPAQNAWLTDPGDRSKLVFVFAKMKAAYESLHDDRRRLEYDEQLRKHDKDHQGDLQRLEFTKTDRQRALEERVRESEALFKEASKLFDLQRFHLAREKVLKAIQVHPEDARFFDLAGRIEALNPNMRWQKDAESHLRRAIELDPWKPEYRVHLGLLYKNAGLLSKAKKEFIRTLELDASNATALAEVPPAERPVAKATPTAPPPTDDESDDVEWR